MYRSPLGRAAEAPRFLDRVGKDEITMKKLLALLVVGGLLGLTTGCPSSTSKPPSTHKGAGASTPGETDKQKADRLKAEKEKAEKEKAKSDAEKEKAEKEKAKSDAEKEKAKADKEKAEKDKKDKKDNK
jgi:hypothetical protein